MLRYVVSYHLNTVAIPWGTFAANVLGSFLLAVLLFAGMLEGWLTPSHRAGLATGVLGAFTTMSSFSYETLSLVDGRHADRAFAYVAATIACCLGAAWLGRTVANALHG